MINQFQQFMERFPYVEYQALKEEKDHRDQETYQLTKSVKKIQEQIVENEKQIKINHLKISENQSQINGLDHRIEKGNTYLQLRKENQDIHSDNIFLKEDIEKQDGKIKGIRIFIKKLQNSLEDLKNEIRDFDSDIKVLKNRPLYSQVIHITPPIYTNKTIENLERENNELKDELNQVSKTRTEIETVISKEEENIKNFNQQIQGIRKEREKLNEILEFPYNGQEITDRFWEQAKELEKQLEELNQQLAKIKETEDKQIGKVTVLTEQFSEKYPHDEVVKFTDPLELVKQQLTSEGIELNQQKEYLQKEDHRIQKQQEELNRTREWFEKFDMKHQYMNPKIAKQTLSPEEITDFRYNRKKMAEEIFAELNDQLQRLESEQVNVNKSKVRFKDFCNNQITDVKMKEMSIKGIENKSTFDEVVQFKHHMENRIQQVTNYAEQHIMSHDEQLQQFITHLLTWIRKIADELKVIPKKTKVKVEEQWKDIYQFHIPEWEEDEGKGHIRNHIEWILAQLEKDSYKDQDGNEDTGKMRKDIETWLQSKQLLRVVMREKTMRVNLHKVSNNNQVSNRLYTWEQSNAWSGGEKWSKNMTLFLGMLNYIAEKRQHIKPKMKRHRTVIVDNPFGKASSEHVLNPVFFIAEQLGFQIIALTALAEGKFLRDYFPIIYSCKLRHAIGSEKQIMTKEKMLHHAYFQDHEPESMERLGGIEQLQLF
ncbi:hypothetical protein [Tepidibacillus marianensis]|uniref:hypothetical protein n=1 Tax=Tepidibacillus marianensis TaxID=3131995 RepID=UPI0030CC5FC8